MTSLPPSHSDNTSGVFSCDVRARSQGGVRSERGTGGQLHQLPEMLAGAGAELGPAPGEWSESPEPEPGRRRRLSAAAGRARPDTGAWVTTHPAQSRGRATQESLASVRARDPNPRWSIHHNNVIRGRHMSRESRGCHYHSFGSWNSKILNIQ